MLVEQGCDEVNCILCIDEFHACRQDSNYYSSNHEQQSHTIELRGGPVHRITVTHMSISCVRTIKSILCFGEFHACMPGS